MKLTPPRYSPLVLLFPAATGAATGAALWLATCGLAGTPLFVALLVGAAAGAAGVYADRWRNPRDTP